MDVYAGTFLVMAILVGASFALSRLMDSEPLFPKPYDANDVKGVVGFAVGFTSIIAILAALGIFDFDFYVYVRVSITMAMLFSIYYLLRYRFMPSLLLMGLITTLVIFNPFVLVTMERSSWILVDIAVAILLPLLTYTYANHHIAREKRNTDKK